MIITVGYPKFWGPLTPSQQCTAYGDSIISNQFEPLVFIGPDHLIHPLAAKSWEVSEDFKKITFKIDITRRFSNGEQLTANHFKQAWQMGLSLNATSHNSSTLDVLYYVEGLDSFEKTKDISGIKVPDQETLEITFRRPFRLALDHFAGNRLSAFIKDGDNFLGTGRYIIETTDTKEVIKLKVNPHHPDSESLSDIIIKVIEPSKAKKALVTGEIDAYEFAFKADLQSLCKEKRENLACVSGLEFAHIVLELNSLSGRFFNNRKYRKALQYLIYSKIKKSTLPGNYLLGNFNIDYQVYLPLQPGSIKNKEVSNIITKGKEYLAEMIEASRTSPLEFYYSDDSEWMQKLLKDAGVSLSHKSGKISWTEILEKRYKTNDMDICMSGLSVVNGDPDGIYHALGKNGAILNPMAYQEKVGELLEEGRSILDRKAIETHYQKVSRAILEEIPFVHLGFIHGMSVYRSDKLKNLMPVKNREENRLHFYRKL